MTDSILARSDFLRRTPQAGGVLTLGPVAATLGSRAADSQMHSPSHPYADFLRRFNAPYEGPHLDTLLFPLWVAWGAGMFCIDGSGAISRISFQHSHP
jgi:hypothetical protein